MPRSASTRSRMSGMLISPVRIGTAYLAVAGKARGVATYLNVRSGFHGISSEQAEAGALAVHHGAGMAVDEDEHRLPLVRVLHEPDRRVEQLAIVRRRVDLDRLEGIAALLRLPFRELVRERGRLRLRLGLGDIPGHDLDPARRALIERPLRLDVELEAVVGLELRISAHGDDREVVLELDPIAHPDDLGLRVHLAAPLHLPPA